MPPCVCPTCEGAIVDPDTHDCPALYRSLGCDHPHPAPPPNAGRLLCVMPPGHQRDHLARGHAWPNRDTETERLRAVVADLRVALDVKRHLARQASRDLMAAREEMAKLRAEYDEVHRQRGEALDRESALLWERDELRKELAALRGAVLEHREAAASWRWSPEFDNAPSKRLMAANEQLRRLVPSSPPARYVVRGELQGKPCWYGGDDPDGPGGLWVEHLALAHAMPWSEAEAKGYALDEATRGKPGRVCVVAVEHRAEGVSE